MNTGLRVALYLLLLAAALVLAACASAPALTPSPVPTLSPAPTLTPTPAATHTPTPTPTPTPAVLTAARLAGLPAAGEAAVRCAGVDEADAALQALCRAADLPGVTVSLARLPGGVEAYPLAGARPAGLSLRPGMALRLVGWLRGGAGEGRVVVAVRMEGAEGAVVFLGMVEAGGLGEVLAANGYGVARAGEGYRVRGPGLGAEGVTLPQIPADDPLYARLEEAMGAVFFDKAVGPNGKETFVTNPIVPPPPADWVPDATAVSFRKDLQTATVFAVDASGKAIAWARYDWEENVWKWKKVEEQLQLTPAELSLEEAKKFIAGAEFWSEEEVKEKFEGRVFQGPRNTKFVLSGKFLSEPQNLLNNFTIAKLLNSRAYKVGSLSGNYLSLIIDGGIFFTNEENSENIFGFAMTISSGEIERISPIWINLEDGQVRVVTRPRRIGDGLLSHWDEGRKTIIDDDGYQIRYVLEVKNGRPTWQAVPRGEHIYVIEDPQKQVEWIVNKMRTERSAYNEKPYVFDDYITTKPRPDVPQIVIAVTNTDITPAQQQMINDWFLNDGRNLSSDQKKQVQALLAKIGNGFTRRQADAIARFIDELLDKSERAREIFRVADVRFIVQDNYELKNYIGPGGTKYGSDPNHFNDSLFGMEVATYYGEDWFRFAICGETARIFNEQIGKGIGNEPEKEKIRDELLKIAPPFKYP